MKIKFSPIILAGLLVAACLVFCSGDVQATEEIGVAEGVACTVCHDKPGSKLYTDKGKYYETIRSLEGYDEIVAAFSSCVTCHVRKPGSTKLTARGKRFARGIHDMEELKNWVLSMHPKAQQKVKEEPIEPKEDPPPK